MRKLLIPLFVLLAFTQSCNTNKKKAFEFNQKLATISLDLNTKGKEFGKELQAATVSRDFSKVKTSIGDLQKFVDDKISELQKTDNVAGSEKLKESMLGFLEYEKVMIRDGFGPFAEMNENTSDEDIQAAIKDMTEKTKDENDYLEKVRDEQKKYADKNKFKIESK